jgi:hypothetical protein
LTLYQCPASRINTEAIVLDTCATNALCEEAHSEDATSCPAPACSVGQTRCSGTSSRTLQMCNGDRTGFADCDTCDSGALCTDSLGATTCNTSACHVCLADQKRCDGSELQICNSAHTGWTTLTCASEALCEQSLTPASQKTCDVCLVDDTRCDASQPQVCQKSISVAGWVDTGADCGSVELCEEATGTCICVLGETRCDSTTGIFATCASDGWTETPCDAGCDDEGCLPADP